MQVSGINTRYPASEPAIPLFVSRDLFRRQDRAFYAFANGDAHAGGKAQAAGGHIN
jgi:hypothetical protein